MMKILFFLWALLLVEGVFGVQKADVIVSVMEGDSVTLKPSTEIPENDTAEWWFGEDSLAQMNKAVGIFPTSDGDNVGFRGRLELDNQTGSLTITNIRTNHTGVYKLKISVRTVTPDTIFRVTVHDMSGVDPDGVKIVSVMKGDTVPLFAGVSEIQKNDQIQFWKRGNPDVLIANLSSKSWNNIRLNDKTGKLDIIDIQSNQSGDYRVEIITSSMNLQRKFRININVPDKPAPVSGLSSGAVAGIVVGLLLLFTAVIVAGVIYHRHKISKLERRRDVVKNGTNDPLNAETANSGAS